MTRRPRAQVRSRGLGERYPSVLVTALLTGSAWWATACDEESSDSPPEVASAPPEQGSVPEASSAAADLEPVDPQPNEPEDMAETMLVETSAVTLYEDFMGMSEVEVTKAYVDRALRITGGIEMVDDEGELLSLWLDTDSDHHVRAVFDEAPPPAKAADLDVGDAVTVQCELGGKAGEDIKLVDCDLVDDA